MSLLIGFLPGVGSPVRQASLCSTPLHSTLDSAAFLLSLSASRLRLFPSPTVNPSLSLFLSLPLPCRPSLPRVLLARTLSPRLSTPFRLLPRPPPYPPNESAPTGALLASLSNPRVRLANTHVHTHWRAQIHTRTFMPRRSRRGALAVTHATGGFSSLFETTPSGCRACMCSTATAPTRETPTVGIVYRGIQRPYSPLSLPPPSSVSLSPCVSFSRHSRTSLYQFTCLIIRRPSLVLFSLSSLQPVVALFP